MKESLMIYQNLSPRETATLCHQKTDFDLTKDQNEPQGILKNKQSHEFTFQQSRKGDARVEKVGQTA